MINGLFSNYEFTAAGDVIDLRNRMIVTPFIGKDGYLFVHLIGLDGMPHFCPLHRLIAERFCPRPDGADTVHHIDGDKVNNSADNLVWLPEDAHCALHNNFNETE